MSYDPWALSNAVLSALACGQACTTPWPGPDGDSRVVAADIAGSTAATIVERFDSGGPAYDVLVWARRGTEWELLGGGTHEVGAPAELSARGDGAALLEPVAEVTVWRRSRWGLATRHNAAHVRLPPGTTVVLAADRTVPVGEEGNAVIAWSGRRRPTIRSS